MFTDSVSVLFWYLKNLIEIMAFCFLHEYLVQMLEVTAQLKLSLQQK